MLSLVLLALVLNDDSLSAKLETLAKAHEGKVGIAVKHLDSGESFYYNADEPLSTASLIKLAVMVEAYQQAADGELKLTDKVTLKEEDKVPGSGILTTHFSAGASFSLRDAIHLMIVFSDNTATNLVLDRIGIAATAERMEKWGYPNTKIHAKVFRGSTTSVFPERTKQYGLGSTTARETIQLLEKIQRGAVVNPDACKAMLEHLKKCEDKDKLTRFLPPGTVVAHKTGYVSNARTAAGIIYSPAGPIVVCVLTDQNKDQRSSPDSAGNKLCAEVGRIAYEHFVKKKAPTKAGEK